MDIKNENLAEIQDMIDMLKNTTSIIKLLQASTEDADATSIEDVSNALFMVWDRQIEYISAIEKLINIV